MTAELWTGNGLFVGEIGAVIADRTAQLQNLFQQLLTRSDCELARQRNFARQLVNERT